MALQYLAQAFGAVLTPMNMGVLLLSTFAGLIMGMLPGLSATMAVALLTGLTYRLSSTSAIISLIGVYDAYLLPYCICSATSAYR